MVRCIFSLLVVIASLGCVCECNSEKAIESSEVQPLHNPETSRWQAITSILVADMSVEARNTALQQYADIGMSEETIEKSLGTWRSVFGHGPGFSVIDYGQRRGPTVTVCYYPDGEAYAVKYEHNGNIVILGRDDPVTWPKTKNESYRRLRLKKGNTLD